MRKSFYLAIVALIFHFGSFAQAQVKQIEMHIDGYLCGN
jgi:hypothetical protein